MLLEVSLDKQFWGEAVLTTTYLQNRNIEETTHLKEKQRKQDVKAQGVLVGYHGNATEYRILIPATKEVRVSRSVMIFESSFKGKKNRHGEKGINL